MYNTGRTQGQNDVKSSPSSYGLEGSGSYNSGYNKGVTDADNRANPSSANYKAGYETGKAKSAESIKGSYTIEVFHNTNGTYDGHARTTLTMGMAGNGIISLTGMDLLREPGNSEPADPSKQGEIIFTNNTKNISMSYSQGGDYSNLYFNISGKSLSYSDGDTITITVTATATDHWNSYARFYYTIS